MSHIYQKIENIRYFRYLRKYCDILHPCQMTVNLDSMFFAMPILAFMLAPQQFISDKINGNQTFHSPTTPCIYVLQTLIPVVVDTLCMCVLC